MIKLRVYLVDDEPLALQRLSRLLAATGRVEIIGQTCEPEQAIAALTAELPDVCFLDIQMPRLDGFQLLARLPKQPTVVFTTAYHQYALDAFAVNSIDYLLKPIEPQQLERALTKIERLHESVTFAPQNLPNILNALAESLKQHYIDYPERMASRLGDRLRFVELAQVTHFNAEDKLTFAIAEGKAYCVDHSIVQLEKKLNPRKFFRIHRATMVNIAWIKEVSALPGGGLHVQLKDTAGTELTVARDRASAFKRWVSID